MFLDSIGDQRPTGNQESVGRRGQYNYAVHGTTDVDHFRIGDNANGNARRDSAQSSRCKHKRTKAELDQFEADLEEQINGPAWITCYTICTRLAGGGLSAPLLSRLAYWFSIRKSGAGVRAKPRAGFDHPVVTPGYLEIARQIGVDTSSPNSARMQVKRALQRLIREGLIEVALGCPRQELPEEVLASTHSPSDGRESLRRAIWLTKKCEKLLTENRILPRRQGSVKSIKVWLADVRRFGANAAIVMGTLHWRFYDVGRRTLRIVRDGKKWWACGAPQMAHETGLSESQARRAIEFLVDQQQVDRMILRFKSSPTSHLHPNFDSRLRKQRNPRKRAARK